MKPYLYIIIIFLFSITACKKDSSITDLELIGNYYIENDSSKFIEINSIDVRKWGITLSGDTNTLDAVINFNIPDEMFYDQNLKNPKTKIDCIFYLNGKSHVVALKDGIYSFNNFFSQMRNKENTFIVYAKLLDRNNELRRISNVYRFRIN